MSTQCLRSFEQLCSSLGNAKPDYLELMPLEAIKNEYGRLRVWCGNLGALARGHGSIDFRLRESSVMQTNVSKLLEQLLSSLSESIAVVSGSRLPFEQQPCPADLSESETESSDDSDDDNSMQRPRRELEIRLASIQDTLSHLYRLSFKIRNPNLKPKSLKATLYQEIDEDTGVDLFERFAAYDKAHVNELVSTLRSKNADARETDYLVSRLAWAITVRRKQFKYWDNHSKKLAAQDAISHVALPERKPLDIVTKNSIEKQSNAKINLQPENTPSQVHKTLLSVTEATKYDVALDDKTERGTIVSYASTALDLDGRGVDLPPPPLEADKGKEFLCPYCFIIRAHILQDLQPYLCTSHLQREHGNSLTLEQIEDLIEVGETSLTDSRSRCPICLAQGPFPSGLENHLANHLERIATFAFPRIVVTAERTDRRSDASQGPGLRSISAFADMPGALDQESLTREGLTLPPAVFGDEPWSEDTSLQMLDSDSDSKFVVPAALEDEESWGDVFQEVKQSHIPEPDKDPLLQEWRSRNPPKPSFDAMESLQDVPVSQSAEARRDYSDEELLELLVRRIHDRFRKKMKVEGGIDGLYSRILVRRIGRGWEKKKFGSVRALENAFSKVCDRQADRLDRERLAGKEPDAFLFTKEDMLGQEPSDVFSQSLAWKELQSMIGLEQVKQSIQALFDRVKANYHRELHEKEPVQITLNRVFLGPPRAGKTTVSKLYGQILADLGLLSSGEVVTKNISAFIGSYSRLAEKRTKDILESARGKVLIIEDAPKLYPGIRPDNYIYICRAAVIKTLLAEIRDAPGEDRCVILMGSPEQMEELFQNSIPGLARSFPLEEAFHFTDFDNVQLGQILDLKLEEEDLSATNEAKQAAIEILSTARDRPNFGNGGAVEDLLSRAKAAYHERASKTAISERTERNVLEARDFDANYDRASHASENCKSLFKDLIGCEDIIEQFEGFQQIAARMRLRDMDPRPYIPFTFVFKGPPGTGKTTTAGVVAQMYYDMGFLSAPQVVECSVSDLTAEYTGQTESKVIEVLERALGKLLIIDGPYCLGEGNFANEAIGELVDCMAQKRFERKIIIILAGYEEDMAELMRGNGNLRSRFATEVVFHRMRPEHCLQLLQQCVGKLGVQIEGVDRLDSARWTPVVRLFSKLTATKSWANGRDVVRLAERVTENAFNARARRTDVAGPLTVSAKELVTFLESMLEEAEMGEAEMGEAEMAVSATPEDHRDRAGNLKNLGSKLFSRYERTGNMNDLEAAILKAEIAVSAIPEDHPDRAAMLNILGSMLFSRYLRTGIMNNLEEAILKAEIAVSAIPEDHPDRAAMLNNLGNMRKAETGDAYSNKWEMEARDASYTYDGVEAAKDGKALIKNKYGGKDYKDD
ncbi:hypothetical protein DL765_006804 [Monosporascus sp. GIB2]|nr:hypothetical protein DL765_006804 [Monosporascus sp. GIB2]